MKVKYVSKLSKTSEVIFLILSKKSAIKNTGLKDVDFEACKLLGLNFGACNPFLLEMKFADCDISFASFYKLKLKNTKFNSCKLRETDFVDADLTNSLFDNCDLLGVIFENTILEKANLSTSVNFIIDPEKNKLKKAKQKALSKEMVEEVMIDMNANDKDLENIIKKQTR